MMKRFKRGFTLIELLIVVSIIAILSAIAVPNFAQALTRSKVARANNDLRVVAISLEVFHTDHNRYPNDLYFLKEVPYMNFASAVEIFTPASEHDLDIHFECVQPTPPDPETGPTTPDPPTTGTEPTDPSTPGPGCPQQPAQGGSTPPPPSAIYLYENFVQPNYFGLNFGLQHLDNMFGTSIANDNYLNWSLASRGPDLDWYNGFYGTMSCPTGTPTGKDPLYNEAFVDYDPTNGTISAGNIFRTNVDTSRLGFGRIEVVATDQP